MRKTVIVADVYPDTLNSAISEYKKNNQYEPYLMMNQITASLLSTSFDFQRTNTYETKGCIAGVYAGCRVYIDEDIKNGVVKLV